MVDVVSVKLVSEKDPIILKRCRHVFLTLDYDLRKKSNKSPSRPKNNLYTETDRRTGGDILLWIRFVVTKKMFSCTRLMVVSVFPTCFSS